jgi:Cdc6-like AAA superfamily ATPase
MAEALGGVASVLTIVESVANVTKLVLSCKSATKESRRLVRELSYVRGLLTTLEETISEQETSNDTWTSTILLLNDNNGLLHQFEQLLGLLESRIRGPSNERGWKKLKSVLEWPFKEAEALKLIDAVERYKSLIELALENNHIHLSKAIRDDVKDLSNLVHNVLRGVEHGNLELRMVHDEIKGSRVDWQKTGQRIEKRVGQSNNSLSKVYGEIKDSRREWQHTSQRVESLGRRAEGEHREAKGRRKKPAKPGCAPRVARTNRSNLEEDAEAIIKRLSTWDFWARQSDIMSQRVGGTGDWFLSTEEFTQWKSHPGRWLTCYGAPGVGKSVLASIIVDHLQTTVSSSCRVLAYYFDRAYQPTKRYADFLGSLLQQVLYGKRPSSDILKTLLQKDRHGPDLSTAELLTLLKRELQGPARTFLVIDALDEWSTEASDLLAIVSDLESLGSNTNVLVTSRVLSQRGELFQNRPEVNIQPPTTDLEQYIRSRLDTRSIVGLLKSDVALRYEITTTILEKCQGL